MGYCFCCYLRSLHDSIVIESGCSGNDGASKQFWGKKKRVPVVSWWQLSFFRHFIGECQCKYAVHIKMKSREDTKLTGFN